MKILDICKCFGINSYFCRIFKPSFDCWYFDRIGVLQEDLASAIFAQVESLSSSFCVLDEVFEVKKEQAKAGLMWKKDKRNAKNCKGTAFLADGCSVFLHICMVLWRISPHGGILTRCVRGQGNAQKRATRKRATLNVYTTE